jgi:thiol-disulfide isomerase/thioredoxin
MLRNLDVLVIILIGVLACNSGPKNESKNTEADSKENVLVPLYQNMEGEPIELIRFKGKRIVLNYWATWCVPCIEEMPSIISAEKLLKNENYLFLLASDESEAKIHDFISKKGFDLNFIKFNGSLTQQNIYALPTTFIYNSKGEKVDEIVGAVEWDSDEIIKKLRNVQ